jgi:uncharacterized membrane protein
MNEATAGAEASSPGGRHPALRAVSDRRAANAQLRIADGITRFAGSMMFVYVHLAIFAAWMLVLERSPWPTLTLVVSLEAIFLSTFVMIGQNRQASFQQAKADHDFTVNERELHINTELTKLIHQMTADLHKQLRLAVPADTANAEGGAQRNDTPSHEPVETGPA